MKSVLLNHWYVNENTLSIALMKFHAKINIYNNGEFIYYQLNIIDSNRNEILFNFYALEDAIDFVESTIVNCKIKEEIVESYKKQLEEGRFKSLE